MRRLVYILLLLLCTVSLKAQTWVIDAGHGGHDGGCEGSHSCEKTINLRVAQEVVRLIKANMKEIHVVMTRDADFFVSLENRCHIANNAKADLFLSIHVNAAPDNNTVCGTESYFGPLGGTRNVPLEDARRQNIGKSEMLARLIQRHYSQIGRPSMRGVKQERYWVVLHTMMPSVLTEVGFISTPSEEELMNSDEGMRKIARSIFDALQDYQRAVRNNSVNSTLAELRRKPLAATTTTDLASNGSANTPTTPVSSTAITPVKTAAPVELTKKDTLKAVDTKQAKVSAAPAKSTTQTSTTTPKKQTSTTAKQQTGAKTNTTSSASTQGHTTTSTQNRTTASTQSRTTVKTDTHVATQSSVFNKKGIEFSVQLCSVRTAIKEGDARLKGLSPVRIIKIGDVYKCYYGSTNDYEVALKLKQEAAAKLSGVFLVAYKDGVQISVADAKEMYKDYMK